MIHLQHLKILPLVAAIGAVACSKDGAPAENPSSDDEASISGDPIEDVQPGETLPTPAEPGSPNRPELTSEDCTAHGGQVIGDIGDGAVYEEAYMCPSGEPPTGNIVPGNESSQAVEGAVCCP